MKRLKSIDEIYEEVKDFDMVITNDVALETALNARMDTAHIGTFAITPRHLAQQMFHGILGSSQITDLELVAMVSEETGLDFKYVYSEILNFREIRRYNKDVRKYLTTKRSRRVYDSYVSLPTCERAMDVFDPFQQMPDIYLGKRIAVIEPENFDQLDKQFNLGEFDEVHIFTNEDYEIPEFIEVGNDRQLADNAVDLIDPEFPEDYAIVLRASSPIADAVRTALYRKGLPFVNSLSIRDMVYIRDYICFISYALDYDTVRVGAVRELFSTYNGNFKPGRDGYLLSRLPDFELERNSPMLRDLMRDISRGEVTFGQVAEAICDRSAKPQVQILIDALNMTERVITPHLFNEMKYAVDNVTEIKHNEQIPLDERKGVLIADSANSVYIDRPVVIYLGMGQDWNIQVVGKRYLDASDEAAKNAHRLAALLQQGQKRIYCVNATKNGKAAQPCSSFDIIMEEECKRKNIERKACETFSDIAPVVKGRWVRETTPESLKRGEILIEDMREFSDKFSKSTFNAYYSCPRCYMFRCLLPTEEEKTTAFGTLIHSFAELYAGHRDLVRERGLDEFVDMVSDRYTGLSTPLMSELDSDAVRVAMMNIMRYIDLVLEDSDLPLDKKNDNRSHPNRFLEELGLDLTSTACELDRASEVHEFHGEFDLLWRNAITDYKTGKAKDGKELAKAMVLDSGARFPEFQPLMYLAIAMEENPADSTFKQMYVMHNDVSSLDRHYDINQNIRTVTVIDDDLPGIIIGSHHLYQELATTVSKQFSENLEDIIRAVAEHAVGEPGTWCEQPEVINAVAEAAGYRGKNPEDALRGTINKIADRVIGGMLVTSRHVEVPKDLLDAFAALVDGMHAEASARSLTVLPAEPRIKCRDCRYFQACTEEAITISDSKGGYVDE